MRQLVSYDDITPPQIHPPSKKRRRTAKSKGAVENWDDPKEDNAVPWDEPIKPLEEEEEESRELTHEEIWDDSALVEAWNAATEEYEAFHGPEKRWKEERAHKSPLWYNVPPTAPITTSPSKTPNLSAEDSTENNSHPVDFATFVPSHDPALPIPVAPHENSTGHPIQSGPRASQDEAFTRALGAMYWAGYWTALYYSAKSCAKEPSPAAGEGVETCEDEDNEEIHGVAEFASTQR